MVSVFVDRGLVLVLSGVNEYVRSSSYRYVVAILLWRPVP